MSPQTKKARKAEARKNEQDSQSQPDQPGEQTEDDSQPQPDQPEEQTPPASPPQPGQPEDAPPDSPPQPGQPEEGQEEQSEEGSEESQVSDYQPKHPTLENAGLDQHAAEEERVAARTAQREEHLRRTAGVA